MPRPLLRYREVAPPPDLAAWVEAFWFIHTLAPALGLTEHWVLPEPSINLVFWLPSGWRQPHSLFQPILSGPSLRAFRKPAIPGEAYFGIRFLPGAGGPFFDCQSVELCSVIQPLHLVQPRWAERLAERLSRCDSECAATTEVCAELRRQAARLPAGDRLMLAAAAWQRHGHVGVSVEHWGQQFGLSERQFRRRFQAAIGLPPKAFARVTRLQSLIRQDLLRPKVAWAPLAFQAGFADQAHLANDFRALSGSGPTRFHQHLHRIDHTQLLPPPDRATRGRFLQDTLLHDG